MRKSMTMLAAVLVFMVSGPVFAHFGMLIPSQATVSKADPKTVDLQISFSHPVRDERHGHGQAQGLRRDERRLERGPARHPEADPGDGQGGLVLAVHPEEARRLHFLHGP